MSSTGTDLWISSSPPPPHLLSLRFGHQDGVSAIDCLQRERPVTAGSNDRTVRVWKVIQESQLVFNGHKYGFVIMLSRVVSGG